MDPNPLLLLAALAALIGSAVAVPGIAVPRWVTMTLDLCAAAFFVFLVARAVRLWATRDRDQPTDQHWKDRQPPPAP